jgi:hypothetical protein
VQDHKPSNEPERERIQNAGGTVMIQRVNGSLAVSRALGDFEYKNVEGKGPTEQLVSPEPEFFIKVPYQKFKTIVSSTEYRTQEWKLPISGLHSIMMEKSALAGEGGGCTPLPFHSSNPHVQSFAVYTPAERADTLNLFHLYCSLLRIRDVYPGSGS